MNLSLLNGKRIAVEMVSGDRIDVVRGTGEYDRQHHCGPCLKILVDEHVRVGILAFILHERKWNGDIALDSKYGCDYRVRLDRNADAAEKG